MWLDGLLEFCDKVLENSLNKSSFNLYEPCKRMTCCVIYFRFRLFGSPRNLGQLWGGIGASGPHWLEHPRQRVVFCVPTLLVSSYCQGRRFEVAEFRGVRLDFGGQSQVWGFHCTASLGWKESLRVAGKWKINRQSVDESIRKQWNYSHVQEVRYLSFVDTRVFLHARLLGPAKVYSLWLK